MYILGLIIIKIQISDFGVSYWSQDKGEIPPPKFYIGGKDMYTTKDDDFTIHYSFDLR